MNYARLATTKVGVFGTKTRKRLSSHKEFAVTCMMMYVTAGGKRGPHDHSRPPYNYEIKQ